MLEFQGLVLLERVSHSGMYFRLYNFSDGLHAEKVHNTTTESENVLKCILYGQFRIAVLFSHLFQSQQTESKHGRIVTDLHNSDHSKIYPLLLTNTNVE